VIEKILEVIDQNQNQQIDYREFLASTIRTRLMYEKNGEKTISNIMQAFNFFDQDGNGEITKTELVQFLRLDNPDMTEDIAEYMIAEVDINNDGAITFEEFA
jgi:Ca2+-binding EF-hand superfamily protein